jgi:bifunctional non-homologous end joining protein LigD
LGAARPYDSRRDVPQLHPALPAFARRPPSGSNWLHEIKHDGFRVIARKDGEGVRLDPRKC